ncbi:MAG: hypothetical protein JKY00_13970 [Roseicyclus sp.]|nr:hypothetical protein [Roseicyclus sp.]
MMNIVSDDDLLATVQKIVVKQLDPARVERVDVEHDVDHDGDPILRIKIVFEIEGDRLNPRAVRGLARHLREPLQELRVEEFPTFSFSTVKEDESAAA